MKQPATENPVPWASFCIATYRRPDRLRNALLAIAAQTIGDFEVVVSDNDPSGSSEKVVAEMADSRIRYFRNETNVGMVKNFNRALGHARGHFVVMITDDDPPYPTMLEVLHGLVQKYPGRGAYYGACDVAIENKEMASTLSTNEGKLSFVAADVPAGAVRVYERSDFLDAFFRRKIFRYVLWSTGIVERSIALEIGGMPDYGSPFLTDFAYVSLAGERKGFVAINTSLGYQAVHGDNSGFTEPHVLRAALEGCHAYLSERLSKRGDWDAARPAMERFLGLYIVGQIVVMNRHRRAQKAKGTTVPRETFSSFSDIPYIGALRLRYVGLSVLYGFPLLQRVYSRVRSMQFRAKRLWKAS
jgi:glycosyltransferase involved in cell wall biosynthesis